MTRSEQRKRAKRIERTLDIICGIACYIAFAVCASAPIIAHYIEGKM